ncbi:winged helix-turn-helix domain-containing protein [Halapricum desulfuricans]|uniref:Transcriptional regulator, contains HTH domain n=1 Tax=Halapricum desulfuricans TaxID=2841257 RepID=A0A897N8J7_9EURY|nr:winged helix-turn-helix domain-containing protein [Halapricum desulfuricans]QSG08834.1 Transcriptional regulator, contains HTH domain [Halapricum desulfuricans]
MDFPQLIAGSGLQILYYLDHSRTATEIAEHSTVSRATVYRRLDDLQQVGIVGKSTSQYQLNDPFRTLSSIARGLYHHRHRREAQRHTGKISIHWETHDEYLFTCDGDIEADGFHLTGPARFEAFDVPLLTREQRQYIRSDRLADVTPADLICHTLLVDDGPRYRTYCLLLMEKQAVEPSALQDRAAHYQPEAALDVRAVVDELLEYLETDGEVTTDQLPEWEEFKRTAAEYDITL